MHISFKGLRMAINGRASYEVAVIYPTDNYALISYCCPKCGMNGGYYSAGKKKSHKCTKCEKLFYA